MAQGRIVASTVNKESGWISKDRIRREDASKESRKEIL
jgi:hypothetical protein